MIVISYLVYLVAAIAVIRTFLNYFLERDLGELRERKHELAKSS